VGSTKVLDQRRHLRRSENRLRRNLVVLQRVQSARVMFRMPGEGRRCPFSPRFAGRTEFATVCEDCVGYQGDLLSIGGRFGVEARGSSAVREWLASALPRRRRPFRRRPEFYPTPPLGARAANGRYAGTRRCSSDLDRTSGLRPQYGRYCPVRFQSSNDSIMSATK
jgi:hypothetical protein